MKKTNKVLLGLLMLLSILSVNTLVPSKILADEGKISVTTYKNTDTDKTTSAKKDYKIGSRLAGEGHDGIDTDKNEMYWIESGTGLKSKRFMAWNTKADGTGKWYRGGQVLKAEDGPELVLYQQWIGVTYLPKPKDIVPVVSINNESNHTTEETAYKVSQAQSLYYRSTLDVEKADNILNFIWGRIDKFELEKSKGIMVAKFDERVKFEKNVDVIFTSSWLEPVGIPFEKTDQGYKFTFDTTTLNKVDNYYVVEIPVKFVDLNTIGEMTIEEFKKPMVLSVSDNYDLGVNAIITQDSYNEIAKSNNPTIKVGGGIDLNFFVDTGIFGVQEIKLNSQAESQYAKLYLTGRTKVNYIEEGTNKELKASDILRGKVYNPLLSNDEFNITEKYNIAPPSISGYTFLKEKDNKSLNADFTEADQELTLVYRKKGTAPVDPIKPIEPNGTIKDITLIGGKATLTQNIEDQLKNFKINRISGPSRYETAIKVSNEYKNSNTVVLASGEKYTDELTATVLANKLNAPVLLTTKDKVPAKVLTEIQRLGATKIVVIGGNGTISETSLKELSKYKLERIGGVTRYETAILIGNQIRTITGNKTEAILVDGTNFPDAIAMTSMGVEQGLPILLTEPSSLKDSTAKAIDDWNLTKVTIGGGKSSVSTNIENILKDKLTVSRVSGSDRYETSVLVAKQVYNNPTHVVIASGEIFPDAIVGAPFAAKNKYPIVLSRGSSIPTVTTNYIGNK